MDIHVLDTQKKGFAILDYIERYETLVWTERYLPAGDFEMVVEPTNFHRNLLRPGRFIFLKDVSSEIMMIESIEESFGSEGSPKLTVKGSSLEAIMHKRVVIPQFWNVWGPEKVFIPTHTSSCARQVVEKVLNNPTSGDKLPNLTVFDDANTTDWISVSLRPTTLYNFIIDLLGGEDLGCRLILYHDGSGGHLTRFYIYKGQERLVDGQPLVITDENDDLVNSRSITSILNFSNTAYTIGDEGKFYYVLHSNGADGTVEGFDRFVELVDLTDYKKTEENEAYYRDIHLQKARESFNKSVKTQVTDGEVGPNSNLVFGKDYFMGDILQLQYRDSPRTKVRVTEYTRSFSLDGERGYPTLTTIL